MLSKTYHTEALKVKMQPNPKMAALVNVLKGGLVIALVDGETEFVIWAGAATAEIQESPGVKTTKVPARRFTTILEHAN